MDRGLSPAERPIGSDALVQRAINLPPAFFDSVDSRISHSELSYIQETY
ncbi:hypothetical protein [Leptospira kirschneri]|nr:hypothetical protein [Leptospira kirschneri]